MPKSWGVERTALNHCIWDYQHYSISWNYNKVFFGLGKHPLIEGTYWVKNHLSREWKGSRRVNWLSRFTDLATAKMRETGFPQRSHGVPPTAVQHCLCAETPILTNLNCRQLLFFFTLWFKTARISVCPNMNIIIFHWAELELLKGFTWRKWKTSWYGTHGQGYTTHHTKIGWTAPIRGPERSFKGAFPRMEKKYYVRQIEVVMILHVNLETTSTVQNTYINHVPRAGIQRTRLIFRVRCIKYA